MFIYSLWKPFCSVQCLNADWPFTVQEGRCEIMRCNRSVVHKKGSNCRQSLIYENCIHYYTISFHKSTRFFLSKCSCTHLQTHRELQSRLKCKHSSVIIEAGTHKAKYRVKSCRASHDYEWSLRGSKTSLIPLEYKLRTAHECLDPTES